MKAYCIYGPPGTGKTTELARMLRWLLDKSRGRTVFVSHTRAAAAEAVGRLGDGATLNRDDISTIHSLCFRLCEISSAQVVNHERLRAFGQKVNVPITGRSPDSEESLEVGDEFLALHSLARSTMRPVDDVYDESDRPGDRALFRFFVDAYDRWKDSTGFVDFNDMLYMYLKQQTATPYDSFVIDEAQDLSPLQWAVIRKMTKGARYVVFAGDDDQSIYGWGGADPRGMVQFEAELGAQRKILDQSYRVPRAVHTLAQSVIHRVSERVDKPYRARDADGLVQRFGFFRAEMATPGTLCLYRNHAFRETFEAELMQAGVPYESEGGRPSPLQTRYGRAWLSWRDRQLHLRPETLRPMLRSDTSVAQLLSKDLDALFKLPWQDALDVPWHLKPYFQRLDRVTDLTPVRLSSIHTAKGREADRVILTTAMTTRTGKAAQSDDEARVFYVGVTRAKQELYIVEGENGYHL